VPRILATTFSWTFALGVGVVMLGHPSAVSVLILGSLAIGHSIASMLLERPG
jgi:hypothetical protein